MKFKIGSRFRQGIARLGICLVGLCLLGSATVRGEEPPVRSLGAITWKDVTGRAYSKEDVASAKATVFFFSSTQCPIANSYVGRMRSLANDYGAKGVHFFLVNSNNTDSLATVKQYARDRSLPFPAIKDDGTALADQLGAQFTPQAILVDAEGTVRYLGRIDDSPDPEKVVRRDLKEALDALLDGKPILHTRTLVTGCAIFREKATLPTNGAKAAYTYARDIAPILNKNCVGCHRAGEIGPFALDTYQQAKVWAGPIKEYTARRLMPPWKPVPGHGDFWDANVLTDAQRTTLAAWADAGAPEGNPKDLPPAPKFPPPDSWTLGTPDQIVQPVRDYHLEAEGRDVYRNFVLPVEFKEDRYLTGMEFKPGNRAIVHHIVVYFDPTGTSATLDGKEKEPGYTVPGTGAGFPAIWGDVWVPGSMPRMLPQGVGIKIPAGAKIVMQVHYHKSGKPETDRSRMALYFAKSKPEQVIRVVTAGTVFFNLKPGESHQVLHGMLQVAQSRLPADVKLWTIFPHMHMLGKEMKVTATLPDGTVKNLIWINDWDFNWQATYYYKEPISLPKGTLIEMTAVYDNSDTNPHQTSHPPKPVRFGEQTTDEMCFVFLGLTGDLSKLPNAGGNNANP